MRDFTLMEGFSLLSLNTQDSLHRTTAKTAALRCILAAQVLDQYFQKELALDDLSEALIMASKKTSSQRKNAETQMRSSLFQEHLMEEVPALLGCDYQYYSAKVSMREYRTEAHVFLTLSESIKADILEDSLPSDQTICYLWLLRESCCIHDIFSFSEQKVIAAKFGEISLVNPLAKKLLPIIIHKPGESLVNHYLRFKRKVFQDSTFQNINLLFPFLERRQTVFIDTQTYSANALERLSDVLTRVESMGHTSAVISTEGDPIVKIDNLYYQLVPHQFIAHLPVYGVRLVPYYPA